MVASVAQVTKQHLVLVLRLLTLDALLAVCALPVIAGDVLQQLQVETNTGGVRALVALAAVEQQLGDPDLVLVHVALAVFAGGEGSHLINLPLDNVRGCHSSCIMRWIKRDSSGLTLLLLLVINILQCIITCSSVGCRLGLLLVFSFLLDLSF